MPIFREGFILPGESVAEFEKLHHELIAEFAPSGAVEDDIVVSMARLLWRKQNFATCRKAELAQRRCQELINEKVPPEPLFLSLGFNEVDPAICAMRKDAIRAAEDLARKELGGTYELVEIGEIATVDYLMNHFEVQDRLDAMIDKCLKRLLFVRGLKSISAAPPKRLPAA